MKNAIRGAFIFIIITLVTVIILDMGSKGNRATETSRLANSSSYNAIKVLANGTYDIDSDEELVTEAIKDIIMNKETDSDIKVQVLGVDKENGMIDLNVIQTVKHVNGKVTAVSDRRTVILE